MPLLIEATGGIGMLATPQDLATLPGMADVDTATAAALLRMATSVVQAITGQTILEVKGDTIDLLGTAEADLWLPQRPVSAVTAVLVNGAAVTYYKRFGARLHRHCGWIGAGGWRARCEPSTVTVTYDHGYPPGSRGLELARSVALMLAAGAATTSPGVTSESIDDYQVVYDKMSARMEASAYLGRALRRQYGRPASTTRLR
jgi:hypothetical protein